MPDIKITISGSDAGAAAALQGVASQARQTEDALDAVGGRFSGLDSFMGRLRDARGELDNLRDAADIASNAGRKSLLAGGATLAAFAGGVKTSLDAFGEIQSVQMGLESMLGSPEAAKAKIVELQEFARNSPFDFTQSAKSAQQLLAMGTAADDLIPTLQKVGNAVAAGGGDTETFKGVLTAIGQIRTKGKVSAEELMQIAERGIDPFTILRNELGLTQEEVANIGTSGIDAEKAINALVTGMGKLGGGTAMEKQMETLPGQMSSLQDSAQQTLAAIGEVFSADASNLIGNLTTLLDKTAEFVKQNPQLVKTAAILTAGIGGTAVVGGGALMIGGGVARGAMDLIAITKALRGNKGAADDAAGAKEDLAKSTLKDAAAERLKTGVASKEAEALASVGDAAKGAAGAKDALASATDREAKLAKARSNIEQNLSSARAARANAADGSAEAAALDKKIKMLRAARERVMKQQDEPGGGGSQFSFGDGLKGAAGSAALAALTGDTDGAVDALKGGLEQLAQEKLDDFLSDPIGKLKDLKTQGLNSINSLRTALSRPLSIPSAGTGWLGNLGNSLGLRAGAITQMGGAPVTGGMALGSAALGAAAGYGVSDDMRSLGYSTAESAAAGALAGVGAAATALFVPGGAVAVAATTGFRYLFNELVNRPMERAAEEGSGLDDATIATQSKKTRSERAEDYFALARQKEEEAANIDNNLFATRFQRARADELRVEADLARRAGQSQLSSQRRADNAVNVGRGNNDKILKEWMESRGQEYIPGGGGGGGRARTKVVDKTGEGDIDVQVIVKPKGGTRVTPAEQEYRNQRNR